MLKLMHLVMVEVLLFTLMGDTHMLYLPSGVLDPVESVMLKLPEDMDLATTLYPATPTFPDLE